MTPTHVPSAVPSAVSRQVATLVAVAVLVGWFDQVGKAWGWRTVSGAHIDSGGGWLLPGSWGVWWAGPTSGPVLDVAMAATLGTVAALVVRRRRPPLVLAGAVLAVAGWTSNLADRFGLHAITAPGSGRGVVDYIVWDGSVWNLADLAIVAGTALFVLGLAVAGARRLADIGYRHSATIRSCSGSRRSTSSATSSSSATHWPSSTTPTPSTTPPWPPSLAGRT